MGIFRSLKGVLSSADSAPHSPGNARSSSLEEELRALKQEIQLLREALGGGVLDNATSQDRGGRGGRGRGRGRDRNREGSPQEAGSFSNRGQRRGLPKTPPDDAPVGLLVDYLKTRDVLVFEGQDELGRNEAFDHLARHIGQHFVHLSPFYEKMKRCVASGRGQRIDIDRYSEKGRSAAVQLGTLLHRHGMLKDFYYHRSPKRQLRVIPTKDGDIAQFLTGGWLEIYATWLLNRRLKSRMSAAKYQVLQNVKGTLPDGREFEADLMAFVGDQFFWLECKTGQWQDYSARFRGLVKTFGVDRKSAGLVLLRAPDSSTRGRATDLLEMTLLALPDLETYFDDFLEIPEAERVREAIAEDTLPLGAVPALSEEEVPLENAEPAKRLGHVNLAGSSELPPRRRRRRRGVSSATAEPSHHLKEALPITPDGEKKADESAETLPRRRRRPRRRPGGGSQADSDSQKAGDSSDGTSTEKESSADSADKADSAVKPRPKAPSRSRAKRETKPKAAEEKPKAEAKPKADARPTETKSARGVTIAPDLAAMMAGAPKAKPTAKKKTTRKPAARKAPAKPAAKSAKPAAKPAAKKELSKPVKKAAVSSKKEAKPKDAPPDE